MNEELKKHVTKCQTARLDSFLSNGELNAVVDSWTGSCVARTFGKTSEEKHANAELIAEAFLVFSETGLTPRELQNKITELATDITRI